MAYTNYYEEFKVNIPEGESGPWKVSRFEVTAEAAAIERARAMFSFSSRGRGVPEGTYTRLTRNGNTIMSDTPDEIRDHREAIRRASGHCLVNGLGLGMVASAMLAKPEVEHVTVIELSEDVIKLVGTHLQERFGDRLTIIQADAYEYKPPKGEKYDVVWHDIWDDLCTDNLEGMHKLHRKYGRRAVWQGSWSRELCEYHKRQERRQGWY
jgi:hypothetical protein